MPGGIGILELLVMLAPFAFSLTIIWLSIQKKKESDRQRAEVQKEVIAKFSSGAELRDFLKSEEGRAFFKDFPDAATRGPRDRVMQFTAAGVLIIMIGAGFLIASIYVPDLLFIGIILP